MRIWKSAGIFGAYDTRLFHNTQYCYLDLESLESTYKEGEDVALKVTAIWRNNEKVLQACSDVQTLALGDYEYIDHFTNKHPAKQIQSYPENIRVSYARVPSSPTYDYVYPESRTPEKCEKVSLNMEGDVTLKSGWNYQELMDFEASMWSIEKGVIEYNGEAPVITKNDRGFHYKFPVKRDSRGNEYCEWDDYISDSVQYGNQAYDFSMKIEFYVTNGSERESQTIETSTLDVENPPVNYQVIPPIRLFWGCIGKDSLIRMADGSSRLIEKLRIGDRIVNDKNEIAVIENVMRGREKEILHIETESGCRIDLCENHPIMTEEGYVPARELTGRSALILNDGRRDYIRYAYCKEYGEDVYSLSLSGSGKGYIANEFVVGTYETENTMRRVVQELPVDEQVMREIERLREDFDYVGISG